MKSIFRKSGLTLSIIFSGIIFNFCYAGDTSPKFICTLTNKLSAQDQPGVGRDTFAKNTPVIYYVCMSNDVKKGQVAKAAWIAADTHHAAPENYKIDEKSIKVIKDLSRDEDFTANFSLSIPNGGWPAGRYHVDLYLNDKLIQSAKFFVK